MVVYDDLDTDVGQVRTVSQRELSCAKHHGLGAAGVSDEIRFSLSASQIRFRTKGGHGGHNGMRNIIDRLGGSKDFCRLRVGIGRPENSMVRASHEVPYERTIDFYDAWCSSDTLVCGCVAHVSITTENKNEWS